MKGTIFGLVVLTAIGIAILSYFGYLGSAGIIQVKAQYVEYTCGEENIDMRVVAVSDSSAFHLIGKSISPELTFKPERLETFIRLKTKSFEQNPHSVTDFLLVGYVRNEASLHCSGSLCFKVEKIKSEDENEFTEF